MEQKHTTSDEDAVHIPPSCTDEAIAALTAAIQSDHEHVGLRAWSRSDKYANTALPGMDARLVRDAFRGRRIAILGDSTMRSMNKWLNQLLLTRNDTVSPLASMDVSQANDRLCKRKVWNCFDLPRQYPETNIEEDGTSVRFVWGLGYANRDTAHCPEFEWEYRTIRETKPHVVIANMGLHWLHLHGARSFPGCVAERWVRYEDWLEELVSLAEDSGASTLLLKTTNRICDERYNGKYAAMSRLYNSGDTKTLAQCFDAFRGTTLNSTTDEEIANYCQNGTLTAHGSEHLNERLLEFVEKRRRAHNASLTLRVFNDRDIQSCEYTSPGDGRHFPDLNLVRLRLLGNLLSCTSRRVVEASSDASRV